MIYIYETDDGEILELAMTVAEMESRQKPDGTIVLDDGRVARRNMGAEVRKPRGTLEVDHASLAYGVNSPEELAETLANNRKYFGSEAPDYYDRDGKAHWTGEIQSVIQRKRAFGRKLGCVDKDSYL